MQGVAQYQYLIHDPDSIFARHLDEPIKALVPHVLKSPIRGPKANAIYERLIEEGLSDEIGATRIFAAQAMARFRHASKRTSSPASFTCSRSSTLSTKLCN
jgi:hypothetical protein